MKTAIIFGISGQDGAFLAKLLLEKQYRVIGVSRNINRPCFVNFDRLNIPWKIFSHPLQTGGGHRSISPESISGSRDAGCKEIELVQCAMLDDSAVLCVLNAFRPHEVYDLSGQSSVALSFERPMETYKSIAVSNLHLLEALRRIDFPVKMFSAGSSECFGDTNGEPANEKTVFSPTSPYAVAKTSAFYQTANHRQVYHLFACTGIMFNHESFLRPETFVTRKIVAAACRIAGGSREILTLGNISIERDWGWAPEYVKAMWMMLQQDTPEDYVIATGTTCSLGQFIDRVFKCLGLDWKDHVETHGTFMRPTDVKIVRADPGKAQKELGWKARYTVQKVAERMVAAELDFLKGK